MKRKKNRILSLVLCASIVLSGGAPMTFASAADENVAVAAQVNENGYASEVIGNVRVQVLSPTVVRLEEQGPEGFEDRETFHIANRDNWEGTGVTREDVDGSVILRTSAFDITVPRMRRTSPASPFPTKRATSCGNIRACRAARSICPIQARKCMPGR